MQRACYRHVLHIGSQCNGSCRSAVALCVQRRGFDSFRISRTTNTQIFARGNALPAVMTDSRRPIDQQHRSGSDNMSAAMSLTGNALGIAYDGDNIFHVHDYSAVERDHYRGMPGITQHAPAPVSREDARATAALLRALRRPAPLRGGSGSSGFTTSTPPAGALSASLEDLWWQPLLRHYPVLHIACDEAAFRPAWEDFYEAACGEADDAAAVTARSVPFLREQRARYAMHETLVWRIAEHLADALDAAPRSTRYEKRVSRGVVECVTKRMLDTVAAEPWAHEMRTSPLTADVANYRAAHDANFWNLHP